MSSVHDVAQGIHRNARTIGLEPLLNLLQREERDLPVIEDTDKIRWLMLASEIDKHNTSLRFGPDGVLDDTNAAVHRNAGQYIVQRPTLSQSYDILHDDSAAGGLHSHKQTASLAAVCKLTVQELSTYKVMSLKSKNTRRRFGLKVLMA